MKKKKNMKVLTSMVYFFILLHGSTISNNVKTQSLNFDFLSGGFLTFGSEINRPPVLYSYNPESGDEGFLSDQYYNRRNGDGGLGSRRLKFGDSGRDVDELIIKLTGAGYLYNYRGRKLGDYYIYNEKIENALKHFLQDAGIKEDIIISENLILLLNLWDPLRSTISIGFRELKTEDGTAGNDIDELVGLLTSAGFPPQKELLKKTRLKHLSGDEIIYLRRLDSSKDFSAIENSGIHYIFTEDLKNAVKAFQAFHGIKPTGAINEITIRKLKSYKISGKQ